MNPVRTDKHDPQLLHGWHLLQMLKGRKTYLHLELLKLVHLAMYVVEADPDKQGDAIGELEKFLR